MKILIVDDDENSRVYLERALLKCKSYTVESAENGVLAFEKALLSPPDMIISDIMMPEMNGFDLCRKVKTNEQLQHIPFIFYSATFSDKRDEELAKSLGASRFVVKPIKMEEFFKIIIDVIEEESKENKWPVPEKRLAEIEKIDQMYSETIARKLEKKVAQLQKEIAEHKQVEEALQGSDQRLRLVMKTSHIGVWDLDLVDHSAFRTLDHDIIFGYDKLLPRWTYEMFLEHVLPEDRPMVDSKFKYAIENRSDWNFECRIRRNDGEVRWIWANGRHLSDTTGTVRRMAGIVQDITERKWAEEEITWNLAINQTLSSLYIPLVNAGTDIEQIADTILDKSRQLTGSAHGFVAEIDPDTKDHIAYTLTRMIQSECKIKEEKSRKITFPRGADGLYNGLWGHALNTKEPFYTNEPVKHHASKGIPEEHLIIERFLAVPVLLGGELVGQIALSNSARAYTDRDLDAVIRIAEFYALAIQRKRAEERLHYQATLLANVNDAIVASDENYKLTAWNAAAESLYGWKAKEVLGRSGLEIVQTDYGTENKDKMLRAIASAGRWRGDVTQVRKDGTRIPVEVSSIVLHDEKGRIAGYVSVNRDITERKQMEEALRKSENDLKEAQRLGRLGSWDWDATTDTITWSLEYYRIYGFDPSQSPPGYEEHLKAYTPQSAARLDEAVKRNMQTGESYELDLELASTEGQTRWITARSETKRDVQGQIIGLRGTAQDITERKRVEEELKIALIKYKTLFSAFPLGITVADQTGKILESNQMAERLLGLTQEEHRQRQIDGQEWTIVRPDGTPLPSEEYASVRALRENRLVENMEMGIVKARGEITWINVTAAPLPLKGHSVVITYNDITERKHAEEALSRLNRELRAISICNQTLMRAEDEQTLLNDICRIVCDEAGYRMFWVGYAENDDTKTIRPVAWAGFDNGYIASAKLSWAEDTERGQGPAGKAIRRGEIVYTQDFATDPQMAPWRESALLRGYRSAIALPLMDESARVFGVVLIYSSEINAFTPDEIRLLGELAGDLAFGIMVLRARTGRKRAEEALQKSEERLRLEVARMPIGYIVWDNDFRVVTWNPAAEEIFGFTFDEAKGRHPYETIVPHEVQSHVDDIWGRLLAGDASAHSVNENRTKDGRTIVCEWTNTPLKQPDGTVVGVMSMVQDVTLRKQAEEELKKHRDHLEELVKERTVELNTKNEELTTNKSALTSLIYELNRTTEELVKAKDRAEAADTLKSIFLATMSHELRTPLNSIIGFTGIIMQGLSGPLNDEQKKQLDIVKDSANHLLSLINDVLDISKIEAGQLKTDIAPFEMRRSIETVVRIVMPLAEKNRLALHAEMASDLGVIVSDRRRVEQILFNLLSNAIKFTEKGEVKVECLVNKGQVITRVIDTGIGIKPEYMDNLFKPFVQLEDGMTRRFEGTGLGLSICKKLVEMLGGRISVESEYGKGSVFTFMLPLKMEAR